MDFLTDPSNHITLNFKTYDIIIQQKNNRLYNASHSIIFQRDSKSGWAMPPQYRINYCRSYVNNILESLVLYLTGSATRRSRLN